MKALTNSEINYWVARVLGAAHDKTADENMALCGKALQVTFEISPQNPVFGMYIGKSFNGTWSPTSNWMQGGPLLEQFRLHDISRLINADYRVGESIGDSLLSAAMREIVRLHAKPEEIYWNFDVMHPRNNHGLKVIEVV